MEACFGKIDTDLFRRKSKNSKSNSLSVRQDGTNTRKCRLKSNSPYRMIHALYPNGEPFTVIPLKIAKMFVRKHWAKIPSESDLSTIQMSFVPDEINVAHRHLFNYI